MKKYTLSEIQAIPTIHHTSLGHELKLQEGKVRVWFVSGQIQVENRIDGDWVIVDSYYPES